MSDCWALDIAREEELIVPAADGVVSSPGAASSPLANLPIISSAAYSHSYRGSDYDYGQPSASDDGYDTACSPEVNSERMHENHHSAKGRKRKRADNSGEAEEKKKSKKNDNQRSRKREERYYMDALKRIFVQRGFIKTTTPKRAITHFETLKIARMKIKGFIKAGVPNDRMRQICEQVLLDKS